MFAGEFSGLCYKNILTIVSDDHIISEACTRKVLLVLALALGVAINYYCKWRSKLWRHSKDSIGVVYDRNMFIIQATDPI
jgi:hypothetical protein